MKKMQAVDFFFVTRKDIGGSGTSMELAAIHPNDIVGV
jgi:hypothetical protein